MAIARSKVTAQGQTSIPVEVRRRLGIGPGSVLEWDEDGNKIVVRRAGRFSFEDIHRELFGARTPKTRSVDELKEGIRRYAISVQQPKKGAILNALRRSPLVGVDLDLNRPLTPRRRVDP